MFHTPQEVVNIYKLPCLQYELPCMVVDNKILTMQEPGGKTHTSRTLLWDLCTLTILVPCPALALRWLVIDRKSQTTIYAATLQGLWFTISSILDSTLESGGY